jgi:hypothetical protein
VKNLTNSVPSILVNSSKVLHLNSNSKPRNRKKTARLNFKTTDMSKLKCHARGHKNNSGSIF